MLLEVHEGMIDDRLEDSNATEDKLFSPKVFKETPHGKY
jgi:hypothetical protein